MARNKAVKLRQRPPGRPRDDAAGPALLDAARRLVNRDGYPAVSIQQIASAAGVAKQTLYRRWPSKAELVLDAFLESADAVPLPGEGPLEEMLRGVLVGLFGYMEREGPAHRSLIASAQADPEFLASFRRRFVRPRTQIVTDILQAAQRRGELPAEADLGTAVDTLHGAFWFRLLQAETLDAAFAGRLSRFICQALGARG